MTRLLGFFLVLGCFCFVTLAVTPLNAQVKTEICDNGIDDDDDKLVDCADPDCKCEPPKEEACSPGFWKNHTELWFGVCCTGGDCDAILAELNAKGPGSDARRQNAADFLEDCLGQPCNEIRDAQDGVAVADAVRDLNLLFGGSPVAPAIASAAEAKEERPVDVTVTVANLHRVFQDG